MNARAEQVQQALAATTRQELLRALSPRRPNLLLPDITRLARHLDQMDEQREPLQIEVVRTYTTELLQPYWRFEALLGGFDLDLREAPYGSLIDDSRAGSQVVPHPPDVTYLFLQWEDLHPALTSPLAPLSSADRDQIVAEAIGRLQSLVNGGAGRLSALRVVSLLPRFLPRELGLYDPMAADSEGRFLAEAKSRIAAALREAPAPSLFADLDEVASDVGRRQFFDPRLWLTSRAPFSVIGSQAAVRHLFSYARLLKQPRAKCILLDADNTLWGGVVGEDGPSGIALGPEYPGSAFVAFQRRLLHFQQRGLLLALCSKNNPDDVLEVLRHHPHQVLREPHFAAIRTNWENKADNVRSIAEELNLGVDSFVFVDDSPHECLALSQALPEMTVVRLPEQPVDIPFSLDELTQLEVLRLTDEDRIRTALYVAERERQHLAAQNPDAGRYLNSLQMVMTVCINDLSQVPRLTQLTQKTNQFNLTTRRYTENDILNFMQDAGSCVASFSLTDIFGDSGVVGLAIISGLEEPRAVIDTFLMSCRVIGRRAESAFLREVLDWLVRRGTRRVAAAYIPTRKNALVQRFWQHHGFQELEPGRFEHDLTQIPACDAPIRVVLPAPGAAPQTVTQHQSTR